jgi:hypothetical protein
VTGAGGDGNTPGIEYVIAPLVGLAAGEIASVVMIAFDHAGNLHCGRSVSRDEARALLRKALVAMAAVPPTDITPPGYAAPAGDPQ